MKDSKCCGCRYYNSAQYYNIAQWNTTCSHCSRYYTDKYEPIKYEPTMSLRDALREEYNRRIIQAQADEESYDY